MGKISKILVSQPAPPEFEKSPYAEICKKHEVEFCFQKFFRIDGISAIDFRKDRVGILDHQGVVMMSRNAVDHYFRMAKDMRLEIPDTMKYFCLNESIALYLQKYVTYRKRKIFFSKNHTDGMLEIMAGKHKNDKFLIPCADTGATQITNLLEEKKFNISKAVMFKNVSCDLKKDLNISDYQMVVLFSPSGVESLTCNFPEAKDSDIIFGALGSNVAKAITDAGYKLGFSAPSPEAPSITAAIDMFLTKHKKSAKK